VTPAPPPSEDPRVSELTAKIARLRSARRSDRHRVHVLKRGQTLSEVAARYYGDPNKAWLIAGASGLDNLDDVPAGIELAIPPRALAERGRR
jgi:nucleoid-associated protein YgaU